MNFRASFKRSKFRSIIVIVNDVIVNSENGVKNVLHHLSS